MKKTTSVDLSHMSSGPDVVGRRVGPSRNPVGMTDLQRRLMAGRAGLLELALLRERHQRQVEEAKRRLEEQTKKGKKMEEQKRNGRSRRSVSVSFDDAATLSSSDDDDDVEYEDDDSSLADEVFRSNSLLSNTSILSHRLLATSPHRLPSHKTKYRRMSEFQQRGVISDGKFSFCRTFNGIRLSAHQRRSEGTNLGTQQPRPDIRLTDHYRKPVVISGLTFDYPSPLHAVLSQFGMTREPRCSVGPAADCPGPVQGGLDGDTWSANRKGKGVGFQGVEPVRRRGRVSIGCQGALQVTHNPRERLAVSESSLLPTQKELSKTDSVHHQRERLLLKTLEKEDLGAAPAPVPSASSNVEVRSSEDDAPKRQDAELERSSSEEKDPEEQKGLGFELPKEAVARPRLSRTTLYRLSEEGYFSGSDSQPGPVPEAPPRIRGKGGGRTSPEQRDSIEDSSRIGSTANSPEDCAELKPETGSDPCACLSEKEIETSSLKRLPVFC